MRRLRGALTWINPLDQILMSQTTMEMFDTIHRPCSIASVHEPSGQASGIYGEMLIGDRRLLIPLVNDGATHRVQLFWDDGGVAWRSAYYFRCRKRSCHV